MTPPARGGRLGRERGWAGSAVGPEGLAGYSRQAVAAMLRWRASSRDMSSAVIGRAR